MLEAEKRGTPPKSEKAAAFWCVGGAGRGVQPFLRGKTSESNKQNNETIADSANQTKNTESHTKKFTDSAFFANIAESALIFRHCEAV
ncbi:hypothetical protein [Helicobacter sp. 23-1045]